MYGDQAEALSDHFSLLLMSSGVHLVLLILHLLHHIDSQFFNRPLLVCQCCDKLI